MYNLIKRLTICFLLTVLCWSTVLLRDRKLLNEELIRFHVVANSDSAEDQSVKLKVRDAVLKSIQEDMRQISDVQEAKKYLQENLPKIREVANQTLRTLGVEERASVSLCKERFDVRYYDTFALPAGVYESLRIIIGEGAGRNWWCVSFPLLCLPATTDDFVDTAVGSGFPESVSRTLTGDNDYEVRFLMLDILGRLENYFFQEKNTPCYSD